MTRTHYKAVLWYSGYDGWVKKGGVKRLLKRVDAEINSLTECSDYNIFNLCELFGLVTIGYVPVHRTPLLTVVSRYMEVDVKIGDIPIFNSWKEREVEIERRCRKRKRDEEEGVIFW